MNSKTSIGIHFGHDASITILTENKIIYKSMERMTRVKHALGINSGFLADTLASCNANSINMTSTQEVPVFFDPLQINLEIDTGVRVDGNWLKKLPPSHHYKKYAKWDESLVYSYDGTLISEHNFPWLHSSYEGAGNSYEKMSMVSNVLSYAEDTFYKSGFLQLKNHRSFIDAKFWQHHFLHALYAAASIGKFENSIIVTGDGGTGPTYGGGGIYFFSHEHGLIPVIPTNGWIGRFYEEIGYQLGLGVEGGAGKLMGLAPYGRPIYFDQSFVGSFDEVTANHTISVEKKVARWLNEIGFDKKHADWDKNTASPPKFISDIAASAQLIFEINAIKLIEVAIAIARKTGFNYQKILLSGGCALNCPANSCIQQKFGNVFVPPAVNDEGLSIAAAVIGWKNLTGDWPALDLSKPYMGYELNEQLMDKEATARGFTKITDNPASLCADMLGKGHLFAVASGCSEVGPRALGHRSLIADPTKINSWEKVNHIKNRERWRPLAPAIMGSFVNDYFDGGPAESNHMLFNYRVKTKDLPAITHFDHSARIQTVDANQPAFYALLKEFLDQGKPPVILNTSLNGRNVPIAENEKDVFDTVQSLNLSGIFTGNAVYIMDTV